MLGIILGWTILCTCRAFQYFVLLEWITILCFFFVHWGLEFIKSYALSQRGIELFHWSGTNSLLRCSYPLRITSIWSSLVHDVEKNFEKEKKIKIIYRLFEFENIGWNEVSHNPKVTLSIKLHFFTL